MEGLIITITALIVIVVIIFGYIFIANILHSTYATEGDRVKFYELEDKVEGTIVKDNGASVEVEYWCFDKGNAIKQIAVVNRMDIYKY